jgi:hypothetical protein
MGNVDSSVFGGIQNWWNSNYFDLVFLCCSLSSDDILGIIKARDVNRSLHASFPEHNKLSAIINWSS